MRNPEFRSKSSGQGQSSLAVRETQLHQGFSLNISSDAGFDGLTYLAGAGPRSRRWLSIGWAGHCTLMSVTPMDAAMQ